MPTDRDLEDAHKELAQAPYESERQELADIDATIREYQARILELHRRRDHIITRVAAEGGLRVRGSIEWAGSSSDTQTDA